MPRNASGTYTLPAGNPVVTGTVIASTWANTTLDDLKTEVTDSLSRSAKGGMLGALALVDGTAALPGLAFNNELSTGLYRPAANQFGFAVAGVERLVLRAVSAAFGHTSPLAAADAGNDVVFNTTATRTAGNLFVLTTGGAARIRVNSAGELALGNSGTITTFDTADLGLTLRGNKTAASGGADVVLNSLATRTSGSLLVIQNNGADRFRVDSDGSLVSSSGAAGVLIFDTVGQVRTNAVNSHLVLRGNKSAADAGVDVIITSTPTRTAGFLLDLQNNGSNKLRVKFDGTVHLPDVATIAALGTNATFTLLGNKNAADTGVDIIANSQATRTAGNLLDVENNGNSKFRIGFDGNVNVWGGFDAGTAFKTDADQTETNAVMTNITNMNFPVAANGLYVFEVRGPINGSGVANANFAWQFTGPAAPTEVTISTGQGGIAGDPTSVNTATAFSSAKSISLSTGTGRGMARWVGFIENGANAGTVQMQFSVAVGGGPTVTAHKGFSIEWRRIA